MPSSAAEPGARRPSPHIVSSALMRMTDGSLGATASDAASEPHQPRPAPPARFHGSGVGSGFAGFVFDLGFRLGFGLLRLGRPWRAFLPACRPSRRPRPLRPAPGRHSRGRPTTRRSGPAKIASGRRPHQFLDLRKHPRADQPLMAAHPASKPYRPLVNIGPPESGEFHCSAVFTPWDLIQGSGGER